MISLREYYEKDGKSLPGKGISLLPEQLAVLVQVLPELTGVLEGKGVEIPRVDYEGVVTEQVEDQDDEEEDEDEDGEKLTKEDEKSGGKKNYESTSDEED
jgi:hypothetical protein